MTIPPDTLARLRADYPRHLLVFRDGDANTVITPDNPRPFPATRDETAEAILVAAASGVAVLMVRLEKEQVTR